mgnify:CR=1 FL=1
MAFYDKSKEWHSFTPWLIWMSLSVIHKQILTYSNLRIQWKYDTKELEDLLELER